MKLKNTFVQGKLNKDIDERLLPKGQYPHAENIRVINSDASNIGAIENVRGTKQLTEFNLVDPKTIGSYVDTTNQKIYWFTTSEDKDMLVEYSFASGTTSILLEDTRGILNFSRDYLITGIVKIYNEDFKRDLLVWTDNLNAPRVINIERSKTYGLDGFSEEQITLAKIPPFEAPTFQFTFDTRSSDNSLEDKFLSFSYRYQYKDGGYSALAPFSYTAFSPTDLDIDYDTLENRGMINNFNALDITFQTGSPEVQAIDLVFKESNSNNVWLVETFSKNELALGDDETTTYRFINDKIYTVLADDELFRLYDAVPNRAKALDLVGSRLVFGNYEEGFDIVDSNENDIEIDYSVVIDSTGIEEVILDYNNLGSSIVIDFADAELTVGSRISFKLGLDELDNLGETQVDSSYLDELDYIINDEIETVQDLFALDSFNLFLEETLLTAFEASANSTPPLNSVQDLGATAYNVSYSGTTLTLGAPTISYLIDDTPEDGLIDDGETSTVVYPWNFNSLTEVTTSEVGTLASIKTLRSYDLGLVYIDKFGRSSSVLTSKTNTISLGSEFSETKNTFRLTVQNTPPKDAVAYRFAVKQSRGSYDNLFGVTFFREGQFTWVKLEGNDVNKVAVGDILYVKADTSGILPVSVETTVLEITAKEENFIENNGFDETTGEILDGVADTADNAIKEPAGTYMKIKTTGFTMAYNALTFFENEYSDNEDNSRPDVRVNPMRNGSFFPILKNASIQINIRAWVERRSEYLRYTESYIASRDYDSFQEFYESEVGYGTLNIPDSDRVFTTEFESNDGLPYVNFISPLSGDGKRRTSSIRLDVIIRNSNNLTVFETKPDTNNEAVYYEIPETFYIEDNLHQGNVRNQTLGGSAEVSLNWFNTYAMGEGIESIAYLDGFNQKYLNADTRPNSTLIQGFSKSTRFADLTYSEVYNENTNLNGLNEFNPFRANFKDDIDKKYGSIQKVYARDTDVVVFQEDKVHRVLFGKDLLMNADGSSNVSSIEEVLGQHIAYTGEYGISRNPESFAFDANNLYFTDVKRGSVLRLGGNGITEISNYGMRRYFKDEFRDSLINKKVGAFDPYHDQYVLSLSNDTLSNPITIACGETYRENAYSGVLNHILDLGAQQGTAGVVFSTNGIPTTVTVTWGDQTYSSGLITDTDTHQITFDKDASIPTIATIRIETTECDASIELQPICVVAEEINVVSVILNDDKDEGLERISRYRWSNGGYSSVYKTFNSVFEGGSNLTIDGRLGKVDIYDVNTGEQGVGLLPIEGSTITIESVRSVNNPQDFIKGDRLGYLVSDVEYAEAQIQSLVSSATFLTPINGIEANGEPIKSTSFVLPATNNKYIYLIWDYILKNEAPIAITDNLNVQKGESVTTNIVVNDLDADGDTLVIGDVTQPTYGTVTFNGVSVTYTHDDTNNFEDSFTYRVFDGLEYSEYVTVNVNIGLSCSEGISASGSSGIYEVAVNLGTDTGLAGISYDSKGIRDRFEIIYDGVVVADSLYVGNSQNQIGTFSLPVFEYDDGVFNPTGETRTITNTAADIGSGGTTGTLTFNKTAATPTTMIPCTLR